ncbi:MAG TPA: PTPDL family protein, partial [Verrucomicrobiaceae bacterium]
MKRLPVFRLLACIAVFALAARLAVAQQLPGFSPGETAIITMKSGDKFEGKVLRDAPDSVEIEYWVVKPKIKDKKILLKSDIETVKKQSLAEVEFAERGLGKILPTPDLKDASYYESTIQDRLRTFAAKYPGTPEATEVEKIITTLSEEKSEVLSGQVKMEGRWLDPATVNREAYNIDAYREYLQMKEKAAENKDMHYLEALRSFERLHAEHPISPYFIKAIPDALDYLKKYEVQLGDMIKEAPILIKKREDGLKQLTGAELQAAKKAIDEDR